MQWDHQMHLLKEVCREKKRKTFYAEYCDCAKDGARLQSRFMSCEIKSERESFTRGLKWRSRMRGWEMRANPGPKIFGRILGRSRCCRTWWFFYFYLPNSKLNLVLRLTDGTARISCSLYDLPDYAATGIRTQVRELHLFKVPQFWTLYRLSYRSRGSRCWRYCKEPTVFLHSPLFCPTTLTGAQALSAFA